MNHIKQVVLSNLNMFIMVYKGGRSMKAAFEDVGVDATQSEEWQS